MTTRSLFFNDGILLSIGSTSILVTPYGVWISLKILFGIDWSLGAVKSNIADELLGSNLRG